MKTLLVLDFVNEIIHKDGKLSSKGYYEYTTKNNTLANVISAINFFDSVVGIRLAFAQDYSDHSVESPLLGKAKEFKALQDGTWATKFHADIPNIKVQFTKNRISPFSNPEFPAYLKEKGVTELYIAGVSTDLAVLNTAFDGHNKDYKIVILEDCCAAANDLDHTNALTIMKKFAKIISVKELL